MSIEFEVDFRGSEEKAEELFMKIDNNKQGNRGGKGQLTLVKKKGINELKDLKLNTKFMSYGTRSRGGYRAIGE